MKSARIAKEQSSSEYTLTLREWVRGEEKNKMKYNDALDYLIP